MKAAPGSMRLMSPRELPDHWREQAVFQHLLGATESACSLEYCADELQQAQRFCDEELLTIAEAAAESGYSEEQLRRLVREERLKAEPRRSPRSHIRIRRRNLPKRPKKRESPPSTCASGYDSEEDARSIAQLLEARP